MFFHILTLKHIYSYIQDRIVSMGVISDGSYGIPEGLMYSFPLTIKNREWKIVQGLSIDGFAREKMDFTKNELVEERDMALAACQNWHPTANL